ncbi:MAG: glycosyl hydrolase [Candidatus Omnitrophota bacterium]
MKKTVLAFILICAPAFAYVDPDLNAQAQAIAHRLEAAQGHEILMGAYWQQGVPQFPSTLKQPLINTFYVTGGGWDGRYIDFWGSNKERDKVISKWKNGATIIFIRPGFPNVSSAATGKDFDGTYYGLWNVTGDPVTRVLPGGADRERWLSVLDGYVVVLKDLQSRGIPVVFIPFFEGDCGWFWYGTANATQEQYRALFRDLVEYFKAKGVHNALYLYEPVLNSTATAGCEVGEADAGRYPGNDHVDILGLSLYDKTAVFDDYALRYAKLAGAAARTGKIWGQAEGGHDQEKAPMNNFWSWYFTHVLADPNARNAAFISFDDPPYYPLAGSPSYDDLRKAQDDPAFDRFTWLPKK